MRIFFALCIVSSSGQACRVDCQKELARPAIDGIPIDATPWEWNKGEGVADNWPASREVAVNEAARLLCNHLGYTFGKAEMAEGVETGTYRYSRKGGRPTYCSKCGWRLKNVVCTKH